ncbi:MAG: YraN family protein [Acidobacteriota bacterium]
MAVSMVGQAWDLQVSHGMCSRERVILGKSAEDLAVEDLAGRGYAILARRYRTRHGEIDIVARDGPVLVFVEVKARRDLRCGQPAEAVTRLKQRRIALMASRFMSRHRLRDQACRFDVVSVQWPEGERARIEVIQGAFDVPDGIW